MARQRADRFTVPDAAVGPSWRSRAACRDEDPELFFPDGRFADWMEREAKRVCRRCPVRRDCLTWALAAGVHGIWGGATETERAAARPAGGA